MGRPSTTFKKLQKERARREKAQEKRERKRLRKLEKQNPAGAELDPTAFADESPLAAPVEPPAETE